MEKDSFTRITELKRGTHISTSELNLYSNLFIFKVVQKGYLNSQRCQSQSPDPRNIPQHQLALAVVLRVRICF